MVYIFQSKWLKGFKKVSVGEVQSIYKYKRHETEQQCYKFSFDLTHIN